MRIIVMSFLLVMTLSGHAMADEVRNKKITQLIEAQGLVALWQDQIEISRKDTRTQARNIQRQLTAKVSLDRKSQARVDSEHMIFLKKVNTPWVVNDLVGVWIKSYARKLSNDDLDKLIAFYRSDIGKKDVAATRAATSGYIQHMQNEVGPLLQSAIQRYLYEVRETVRECNCPKR